MAPLQRSALGTPATSYVTLRVGSGELFGFPGRWQSVVARLERYSLAEVLDLLGRISVVLDRYGPQRSEEASMIILSGIFGHHSSASRAFSKLVQRKPERMTAFDELQLVTAAKAALISLPPKAERTGHDWGDLGRALLMINDLVDAEGGAPVGKPVQDNKAEWNRYLVANGFFHFGQNDLPEFGRAHGLYLSRHEELADHYRYMDLPTAFEEITGVAPDVLSAFFFAWNANWMAVKLEEIPAWSSSVHRYKYMENYEISEEEVDQVLALLSAPAETIKTEVEATYEFGNMQSYHVLPIAKAPLIRIEDHLYCPSLQLLKRRFTRGLHHLFLTASDKKLRQQFLDFMGIVFDQYVADILGRTYGSGNALLLTEGELQSHIAGSVCDGLVYKDGIVCLWEAKAPMFSLAATSGASWEDFAKKAKQVFLGGCSQISSTIDAVEAGALQGCGLVPEDVVAYVPLVVTLDHVPLQHLTWNEIQEWIQHEGILGQQKTLHWQAVDIGALEGWEVLVGEGAKPHLMARDKGSSPETAAMTFTNYWHSPGTNWNGHNPRVLAEWEALTSQVLKFFRSRDKRKHGS